MALEAYIAARQEIIALAFPFGMVFLLVAVCLVVSSFRPILSRAGLIGEPGEAFLEKVRRISTLSAPVSLAAGFLALAWFHYVIYRSLPIIDPVNFQTAGRFAVPLWIDTEKIYFWTFSLSVLVFLLNRRQYPFGFTSALNVVLSVFLLLIVFYSNPFRSPLPVFHQEISEYVQNFQTGDVYSQLAAFQSNYGRMRFYYNTTYMWTHPPLLFISYAAFVVSFIAFLFMAFKADDIFDRIAYDFAKFGYLLLTFGILIGYPWAILAWKNEPWWWSPKINVTLVMWILYSACLHSRLYLKRRGMWRTTAIIGIVAFLSLVFTYATTYLIPGVHSYG